MEELRELLTKFQFQQIQVSREYQKLVEEKQRELNHFQEWVKKEGLQPPELPPAPAAEGDQAAASDATQIGSEEVEVRGSIGFDGWQR